ncbi:MAG: ABC transporter ATP-binding protein [Patescibacteria group bacterium]
MVISVSNLRKNYQVYQKQPGVLGSVRSFISRKYSEVHAVEDISFDIDEGELVGFIGPNGAGKTTTLKCLSGLLYPSSGTVTVLGFTPFERKDVFLKQISLVMGQKNQLWWDIPASETFLLNKEIYEISDEQYKKNLSILVDLLDIGKLLHVAVRKLSLGERMKMELVAALLHSPKVLFLDEPTIGLDVVMQKHVRDFIKEYNQKQNATVLLTSHYIEDVRRLAKRVIVIDHGKLLFDGNFESLVKKFSPYKIISVILDAKVEKKKLQEFGEVVVDDYPKAVIRIKRTDVKSAAAALLHESFVADVNIEEPAVEDIIREVFHGVKA